MLISFDYPNTHNNFEAVAEINMEKRNFNERCYKALCQVPKGKVTTYADLARYLGSRGYRAVGNAMNRNPNAPRVPCHRVVRSNGEVGGYAHGTATKIKMLQREGVEISNGKVHNLTKSLHRFKKAR